MNPRRMITFIIAALALLALLLPVVWPEIDMAVAGMFYTPGQGFTYATDPILLPLHDVAFWGARLLAIYLVLALAVAYLRHAPFIGLDSKAWLFLLLGLVVGPGLVANVGLKDHWGRARPREVIAFGGSQNFSPFYEPQIGAHKNGSFVSGDASFGFYLPSFAYVVPKRRARQFLLGGTGIGVAFGIARIMMGAHFFSDVAFSALLMFLTSAALHAAMFGRRATADFWRSQFRSG